MTLQFDNLRSVILHVWYSINSHWNRLCLGKMSLILFSPWLSGNKERISKWNWNFSILKRKHDDIEINQGKFFAVNILTLVRFAGFCFLWTQGLRREGRFSGSGRVGLAWGNYFGLKTSRGVGKAPRVGLHAGDSKNQDHLKAHCSVEIFPS